MMQDTLRTPQGGEIFLEVRDRRGRIVALTYNDLWLMIVCRTSQDGDWMRTREATSMVVDSQHKRQLVDRLWKLEQELDGLPILGEDIIKLNLQRAHNWFNKRPVATGKNW